MTERNYPQEYEASYDMYRLSGPTNPTHLDALLGPLSATDLVGVRGHLLSITPK